MSLATQFLVVAAVVLGIAMAILGQWIAGEVSAISLKSAAISSSVFVDSYLEPPVQQLAGRSLPAEAKDRLDGILRESPLKDRVMSVKIWLTDGTIVYASRRELEGKTFDVAEVEQAAKGEVVARYDELAEAESEAEAQSGLPLIEVYAPLLRTGTEQVIAVGEYYEHAPWLAEQLRRAQITTWAIVGLTTTAMLGVLFGVVARGSRTIARQRMELQKRVSETALLAAQNEELRVAAENARVDANESNEQLIARVGSDLHDGPIQLLSMLMLKLSAAQTPTASAGRPGAGIAQELGASLLQIAGEVLVELRNLSTGLSLPELDRMTLADALQLAVSRHEGMTDAKVRLQRGHLPYDLPLALKICAYRVVQEGLNNSYKHAGCLDPEVSAFVEGDALVITVSDSGYGLAEDQNRGTGGHRLGIAGIRNRVSAFKGTLKIDSELGEGTRITVVLPIYH